MIGVKADSGKTRYELFPWADVVVRGGDYDPSVREVFAGLQTWFSAKPFKLQLPVPQPQVRGICEVLTFGAAKYAARGWESGLSFSRVFSAAARHAQAVLSGEQIDAESGLTHTSHFWCNVLFLLVFTARGRDADLDDRPAAHQQTRDRLDRMQALVAQLHGLPAALPEPTPSKKDN